MNINEIKWEQGTKYKVSVDFPMEIAYYKVIVDGYDLIIFDSGNQSIFERVSPMYLIHKAVYTEI